MSIIKRFHLLYVVTVDLQSEIWEVLSSTDAFGTESFYCLIPSHNTKAVHFEPIGPPNFRFRDHPLSQTVYFHSFWTVQIHTVHDRRTVHADPRPFSLDWTWKRSESGMDPNIHSNIHASIHVDIITRTTNVRQPVIYH